MLSLCKLQDRLGCDKLNLTETETQVAIKKKINCFSGTVYSHQLES